MCKNCSYFKNSGSHWNKHDCYWVTDVTACDLLLLLEKLKTKDD